MSQGEGGGRPLKFKSVAVLQRKINEYFKDCDPRIVEEDAVEWVGKGKSRKQVVVRRKVKTKGRPWTIEGLAVWLDTSRETILDYENGKRDEKSKAKHSTFSDAIKKAKLRILSQKVERLNTSAYPTGIIFDLKNNHKFVDKQEVDTRFPDGVTVKVVNYGDKPAAQV